MDSTPIRLSSDVQSFIQNICKCQKTASGHVSDSFYASATGRHDQENKDADENSHGDHEVHLDMEKIDELLETSIDQLSETSTLRKEILQDGRIVEACREMMIQEMQNVRSHYSNPAQKQGHLVEYSPDQDITEAHQDPTQDVIELEDEDEGDEAPQDTPIFSRDMNKYTSMDETATCYPHDSVHNDKMIGLTEAAIAAQYADVKPSAETSSLPTPAPNEWEARFRELLQYQRVHGDKMYPLASTPLGQWVTEQERLFEGTKGGNIKSSSLSVHQVAKLKSIDFPEKQDIKENDYALNRKGKKRFTRYTWNERFQQLVDYHKKWGEKVYPTQSSSSLGNWVGSQRHAYRNTLRGETEKILTPYQIEKLNSIHFAWTGNCKSATTVDPNQHGGRRSWDERYQELVDYQKVHGIGSIPSQTPTPLGGWIRRQRFYYKKLLNGKGGTHLTDDHVQKLKKLNVFDDLEDTPDASKPGHVSMTSSTEGLMYKSPATVARLEEVDDGYLENKRSFLSYANKAACEDDEELVVLDESDGALEPDIQERQEEEQRQLQAQYPATHARQYQLDAPRPYPSHVSSYHNMPQGPPQQQYPNNLETFLPSRSADMEYLRNNYEAAVAANPTPAPQPRPILPLAPTEPEQKNNSIIDRDTDMIFVSNPKQSAKRAHENYGRWSAEEHNLFLKGMQMYGRKWKKISYLVKTRTDVQIRTHAQKYFQKINKSKERGYIPPAKRRRPQQAKPQESPPDNIYHRQPNPNEGIRYNPSPPNYQHNNTNFNNDGGMIHQEMRYPYPSNMGPSGMSYLTQNAGYNIDRFAPPSSSSRGNMFSDRSRGPMPYHRDRSNGSTLVNLSKDEEHDDNASFSSRESNS